MRNIIKKMKGRWRAGTLVLIGMVALSGIALAEGYVKIHPSSAANAVLDQDGRVATSPTIQFYLSGVPNPNTDGSPLIPVRTTVVDGFNQSEFSQRGTINVRAWTGPAQVINGTRTTGQYYNSTNQGKSVDDPGAPVTAMTLPAPPAPPKHFEMSAFRTDWMVGLPRVASVRSIGETLNRTGDTFTLSLTVTPNYSEGTPKIAASTGNALNGSKIYRIRVWKDGDTAPSPDAPVDGIKVHATDSTLGLSGAYYTPDTWYNFDVQAWNWFGAGPWMATPYRYKTLAGGPGGVASVTYNLKKAEGGLGLNAIAAIHTVPFQVDTATPSSVGTIGQLVTALNARAAANAVATIGWMENGNADLKGWYITYDASGTAKYTPTGGITTGPDTALVKDQIYQISVTKAFDVTFTSQ